jgi:hypothetical protein
MAPWLGRIGLGASGIVVSPLLSSPNVLTPGLGAWLIDTSAYDGPVAGRRVTVNSEETMSPAEREPASDEDISPDGVGPAARRRPGGPTVFGVRVPLPYVALHAVLLLAALGYWAYLDRHLWFYGDEWDFINRRGIFSHPALSIWVPHNEHWSVLPILLWRAIYNTVHLSSYWPYLIPLFIAHLVIVHLVWRRLLREGVPPWLATALAGLLGLLGSGWEDLGWAFQIGFLGSVLFGLIALDLADRDRASWRWDLLIALVSLAGFMCSTGGDSMCAGLFILLVVRRPWRQVIRVLFIPVVSYVIWYELEGKKAVVGDHIRLHTFAGLPAFVWAQTIEALGSRRVLLGALIAILLGIWLVRHARSVVLDHPAVAGLVVASIAFYTLAGLGRDRFGDVTPDRYTYIGVALLLPAIGLALTGQVQRRWRWQPVRPVAIFAVLGIIVGFTYGNVILGKHAMAGRVAYIQKQRRLIDYAAQLIADGHPYVLSYRFPESSLDVADVVRLWKLHQLVHVGSMDLFDQLYFESRIDVALTTTDLSRGRFELVDHYGNLVSSAQRGCETFTPTNPALKAAVDPAIRLRMVGTELSAAAVLRTVGSVNLYVALRPKGQLNRAVAAHTASTGQVLNTGALVTGKPQINPLATAVTGPKVSGVSYLYDLRPGADLVISLPRQQPVEVCDLAPTPVTRARRHRVAA